MTATAAAKWIAGNAGGLAKSATALHLATRPNLTARMGPAGTQKCEEDAAHHLAHLATSLRTGEPGLLDNYIIWVRTVLGALRVPESELYEFLDTIAHQLGAQMPPDLALRAQEHLRLAVDRSRRCQGDPPTHVGGDDRDAARHFLEALLATKRNAAADVVRQELDAGRSIRSLYLDVFQPSQREIGRLWQLNKVSVAQEHYCTAATQLIMSSLYERIFSTPRAGKTILAACVSGDLHELGLRMVADLFELEGWDSHFIGANTPTRDIVSAVGDLRVDAVAISVTLTRHVDVAADLITAIRAQHGSLPILVGGYPFNLAPNLWSAIQADGHAYDADGAIELAGSLLA